MARKSHHAVTLVRKMLIPTALDRHVRHQDHSNEPNDFGAWERYCDPSTGYEYLYHPRTGESKWIRQAVDSLRELKAAPAVHNPMAVESGEIKLEQRGDASCDVDGKSLRRQASEEWEARLCDWVLFFFETSCCEQPAALIEALFRFPSYALAALFTLGVAIAVLFVRCCDCTTAAKLIRQSARYLREALLFLAAAISLLVPCISLVIYRTVRFDQSGWDIKPLPTVLGAVDPRRFWAFFLGRASLANNGEPSTNVPSLDYPWSGCILHPPYHMPSGSSLDSSSRLDVHDLDETD